MQDGDISFLRRDTDWHTIADDSEAFYLRIAAEGQSRYPGADLGILVARGRFMSDEHELLDRTRLWIDGINRQFSSEPVAESASASVVAEPFGFKML
jgi:hypothetical protein